MPRNLTYDDCRRYIGRKLGMNRTPSTIAANTIWSTDVEDVLADSLERFYDPEVTPKHQWSFLTPTIRFEFRDGVYRYDLPANFAMFGGPLTYPPASSAVFPEVEMTSPERVLHNLQRNSATGRPMMAAYRIKDTLGLHETAYELLVYPTPDEDYEAYAPVKINPLVVGSTQEVPLGGQPHRQTILAACLAECAAFNEEDDRYEQRFMRRLMASISHDQQVSCPPMLGANVDRSDSNGSFGDWRDRGRFLVSYEDQNW
jgi:hypothetical protein